MNNNDLERLARSIAIAPPTESQRHELLGVISELIHSRRLIEVLQAELPPRPARVPGQLQRCVQPSDRRKNLVYLVDKRLSKD